MTRRINGLATVGIAVCAVLAACGSDDPDSSDGVASSESSSSEATPPTDEARELADWVAVQMLQKNSTAVCEVGTEDLEIKFAEEGWCENDVAFKETAVTLQFVATCTSTGNGNSIAGDGYLYLVKPDITWIDGKDDKNGVLVVLNEGDEVADFRGTDIELPEIDSVSCVDVKAVDPAEDISLD